jgi:hypothetical protein
VTRSLTETERTVLACALRSAVITYRDMAALPETITLGLVDHFEQRAYATDYLAGMLEDVTSITISNEATV